MDPFPQTIEALFKALQFALAIVLSGALASIFSERWRWFQELPSEWKFRARIVIAVVIGLAAKLLSDFVLPRIPPEVLAYLNELYLAALLIVGFFVADQITYALRQKVPVMSTQVQADTVVLNAARAQVVPAPDELLTVDASEAGPVRAGLEVIDEEGVG